MPSKTYPAAPPAAQSPKLQGGSAPLVAPTAAPVPGPKAKPSRGRIVDYFHPPSTYTYGGAKVTSSVSPAIVQAVNADGTLRLHVFGAHALWGKEGTELIPSAAQAPTNQVAPAGTWQWPVLG